VTDGVAARGHPLACSEGYGPPRPSQAGHCDDGRAFVQPGRVSDADTTRCCPDSGVHARRGSLVDPLKEDAADRCTDPASPSARLLSLHSFM